MLPDAGGTATAWLAGAALTVLKATVLLLLTLLTARLLRRRSAALRHLVWTAGLAAALGVAVLDAGVPDRLRWPAVELPAGWVAAPAADAAGADGRGTDAPPLAVAMDEASDDASGEDAPAGTASGRSPASASATPSSNRFEEGAGEVPPEAAAPGDARRGGAAGGLAATVAWLAALLWAAGAAFVLLRTGWGALRLSRVRRRADPLEDPELQRTARETCRALGGPPRPPIRVSPEISVPMTCGALRPTLLLPQEAVDEWSRQRTEAVLVHELGHVLRRDAATHALARLACAVYWFHPLAWTAAREAAKERERACDDVVLRAGARASEYARHLVEIARQARPRALTGSAAVSVARRGDLEGRVLSVLEDDTDRSPASRGWALGTLLPAVALTVALALLTVGTGEAGARERGAAAGPGAGAVPAADGPAQETPAREGEAAGGEAGLRPDVAGNLVDLLDDPDPAVRAAAAEAVGEMKVRRAVPGLTEALDDPSSEVRLEAADALGEIEDPAAVDALGRALAGDGSREFRKAVAWALGETESPAAVDALEGALREVEDRWLRKRIVRAVGETRREAAVPVLQGLLEERDRKIRRAALEGLVENGTDRAMAALAAALQSDDAEIRALAARALGGRE